MMKAPYPWFSDNLEVLSQAYQSERLPHSLLLVAPEGSGKLEIASYIGKSLLCSSCHGQAFNTCNNCKSCHLFDAQTHPDFYLVDRLVDNKGKQKKSIGIEQIRQLTGKLADTAQLGGWRVAVVTSVSAMTTASFNALLKTLEEPGDKTLLILLTDSLHTVPATIRSRCQIQQPLLTKNTLLGWLQKQTQSTESDIIEALNSCFFAPLKARDYLNSSGVENRKSFFECCDRVLLNQLTPQEFFETVELERLAAGLASYYYHVQLAIINRTGLEEYTQLPTKLTFFLYQKLLELNHAQLSGSNLQEKLQLQEVLIQWFEAGSKINSTSVS